MTITAVGWKNKKGTDSKRDGTFPLLFFAKDLFALKLDLLEELL